MKRKLLVFLFVLMIILVTITAVLADDGYLVRKRVSHSANPSVAGYMDEAEHVFIGMMQFYVRAQSADGTVLDITDEAGLEYFNIDQDPEVDVPVEVRTHAKPLISVYIYGPYEEVEDSGFVGHGRRDAYGAISLDDGETWKKTNLSQTADISSSTVKRRDIPLYSDIKKKYYPGDVVNIFHAIAGNRVLVAWPSRYCGGGQPNYSLDIDDEDSTVMTDQELRRAAIALHLGIDLEAPSPDDLYLLDMYGVAGHQGSVDYADDKFEVNHEVGEVPYTCLWTARGILVSDDPATGEVEGDDPRTADVVEASYIRWFNSERLTSGVRDVNRIETKCVAGAGCAITWQEDPHGLRPGQGEGPGEGWSGATANHETDVWYSYIDWEDFDVVQDPDEEAGDVLMEFADYEIEALDTDVTQKPKPFVPFAMPMRVTDNAKCQIDVDPDVDLDEELDKIKPYCIGAAIQATYPAYPALVPATAYGLKDMCASTAVILDEDTGEEKEICVTEDGMPLVGNTASTRPRLGLYGYDSTGVVDPATASIDSAFVVFVAEESKGLGAFGFDSETGEACTPPEEGKEGDKEDDGEVETCIPFDEGKNIWYYTFSMSLTDDPLRDDPLDGLLGNLTSHGNQLNQPQVDWETGEFYAVANTEDFWDFGDEEDNYDIFNTEIARRGSLLAQDIHKVHSETSSSDFGLIALPAWKQGVMKQGGPADVMVRRIIIPDGWGVADGNPYAFRNMACEEWAYKGAGEFNPYYPEGICLDSATNLSGTVPDTCYDSDTEAAIDCPTVDFDQGTTYGIGSLNPILQGLEPGEGNTTKVLTWHQCPAVYDEVAASVGIEQVSCMVAATEEEEDESTLDDQSWYNPLDVAKGHRGFLDGDFVMVLYAWSPNWRLNTVGHDRYELFIRRSFTGGTTWTNLPSDFVTWDGVTYNGSGNVTCETFRSPESGSDSDVVEPRVCNSYPAGGAEQARNVTQIKSMRITTLDPRYAITGAPQGVSITADPFETGYVLPEEDTRDPSRYFIAYETGDNTTTSAGEAEPLNLYYSRAVKFGDHYQVWAEEDDIGAAPDIDTICYPSDEHLDDGDEADLPEVITGSGFCNEFDQLDQGTPGLEASESSLTANPGGQFMYGVWSQVEHDTGESDAMARRVWWIYDYISDDPDNTWEAGGGAGGGGGGGGGGGEEPLLDLDINALTVTSSVRKRRRVSITLAVENNGEIDGQATATVVGTLNGNEIYNKSLIVEDALGGGATTFSFPSYKTTVRGTIYWAATIADADADEDLATATTVVR